MKNKLYGAQTPEYKSDVPMPPTKPAKPKILYVCDKRACEQCNFYCHHTEDITHAKNFHVLANATFAENTEKETDESVVITMKKDNIAWGIYQFFIHTGADGQTFEESCKLLKEIANMFGAEIK